MKKYGKQIKIAGTCIVLTLSYLLTGCGSIGLARESTFESSYQNTGEEVSVNPYVSEALAVVESMDETAGTVTLYLIDRKEDRTLHYDGTTVVWDKFEQGMSVSQLKSGDIVMVHYSSELDKAGEIIQVSDAWSYEGIDKYNLDAGNGCATIGNGTYSIKSDVQVFSDGSRIELNQIINKDILSFNGVGHDIISITVDKGHGYLDLTFDAAVLGGWIEVGQAVISKITPEMLLTVPEGSYTVRLTSKGVEETREVVINRNKETVLNLSDIEVTKPVEGLIDFNVMPENADLYIDDIKTVRHNGIILPFGLHKITASAEGYETLTQYIYMEEETKTFKMNLDKETEATVSDNSISEAKECQVTVDSPLNAELYQDNVYIGITPLSFKKEPGSHTITLRKTGYVTKSYTIQIEDDGKDVTYSFGELDPEYSVVSGNSLPSGSPKPTPTPAKDSTVSGNTVSGNK